MTAPRVLIVEDEVIIAEDMRLRLQSLGYDVCAYVSSGEEAIGIVEQDRPDLVLMDIILKGDLDGIETAGRIRSVSDIPIVFMTAYADEEKLERAKLIEPFGYILKPFDGRELGITISMALYKAEVDAQRRQSEEKILKLGNVFSLLGVDPMANIDFLVKQTCEILDAACSLYNRLDDAGKSLIAWSGHKLPPDFDYKDSPNGHICYEATIKGGNNPVILERLEGTSYYESDKNVIKYGLNSYLGYPIFLQGQAIGSLCIVDTIERIFSPTEIHIISTLAKAVSLEEERNWALGALVKSEESFRMVADFTYDMETWQGPDGAYLYVSPSCERITGYTREEYMNDPNLMKKIIHPGDRAMLSSWERNLTDRGPENIDYRIITREGRIKWIARVCRPVFDANGAWLGRRSSARDITEKKILERRVKMTQKLESLGAAAEGMAHDFNNIISGILGYSEMILSETPPESPARSGLEKIRSLGIRASDLTRQMLTYSGKGVYQRDLLDMSSLVDSMKDLLDAVGTDLQEASYDLPAELPLIMADQSRIRQLIMGLFTNAVEAIGDDGGTVKLTTGVMHCDRYFLDKTYLDDGLPEGDYVFLSVKDNGGGVDPEIIDMIFDPFFTTKFTGRGLGLAAVLGIVRSHHGAVKVESNPGNGTDVKVFFPVNNASGS